MADVMPPKLLAEKNGLIVGIANDQWITWELFRGLETLGGPAGKVYAGSLANLPSPRVGFALATPT